jgi:hypothetical protein
MKCNVINVKNLNVFIVNKMYSDYLIFLIFYFFNFFIKNIKNIIYVKLKH